MSKFETLPGLSRFALAILFTVLPLPAFAQESKPAASANPAAAKGAAPVEPGPPTLPPQLPGPPPDAPFLFLPDFGGVVPNLIPMPMPTGPPPKPPLERVYRVGKLVIKYGNDVRERNPKLPNDEELAATTLALVEVSGTLYHPSKKAPGPSPNKKEKPVGAATEKKQTAEKGDEDLALHPPAPAAGVTPSATPAPKSGGKSGKKAPKEAPKPIDSEGKPATLKVSDFGEPRMISAMGLLDIYDAIVKRLTDRGLIGVYLLASIEPRSGTDLRQETVDVEIQVFVSEVAKMRTVARRVPFRTGDVSKINDEDAPDGQAVKDPKHLWIKSKSPEFVFDKKKGGLLNKQRLQDYLNRLNRFPGRRVDSAINSTGEPGKISLDYIIREEKPLMVYFHEGNDGTQSSGEWRSRAGLQWLNLANMDDILRFEYVTTDFESFNSLTLSYGMALAKPDILKLRVYGLYGNYTAEDVGAAGAFFTGDTLIAGLAITWTPLYWNGFPLDITLGGEYFRTSVQNDFSGTDATGNFVLPYVALGTERLTERFSLVSNVQFKGSFNSPSQQTLNSLGRIDTNGTFWILNGDFAATMFLEPLLLGKSWGDVGKDGENWKRGMLANEIALLARGQYTLGDRRLIPQLEYINGGYNTVRGYPEAFTAGDSGYATTLEYRLHVPRLLMPRRPGEKDAAKKAKEEKSAATAPRTNSIPRTSSQPAPVAAAGPDRSGGSAPFRFRPATPGTGADWDLIFRVFTDFGQTFNNQIQNIVETDRTLWSVGAGLEMQVFKLPAGKRTVPLYMSVRADYGIALKSATELAEDPVHSGDGRLHFSATISW